MREFFSIWDDASLAPEGGEVGHPRQFCQETIGPRETQGLGLFPPRCKGRGGEGSASTVSLSVGSPAAGVWSSSLAPDRLLTRDRLWPRAGRQLGHSWHSRAQSCCCSLVLLLACGARAQLSPRGPLPPWQRGANGNKQDESLPDAQGCARRLRPRDRSQSCRPPQAPRSGGPAPALAEWQSTGSGDN